jgi:hypothetical protein
MAELDASIPLQVRPPQGIDMLQMLSHVAQLKQAQAQLKLIPLEMQQRQAQIQDTQAQIQQRQRDLEATQKLQGLFADPANHDAFAKGDYSAITEQVSPNIAMPAIEKLNEMQNKAQSLRGEQAKFYAEGRGRLQDLIQSIDPSQPQAPQQFAQGVQALGQEHPELVKQLQPPQQGQDFGQYLNGLATVNGLGHKILENAAALKEKEAMTAERASSTQRNLAEIPKIESETAAAKLKTAADQRTQDAQLLSAAAGKGPDALAAALGELPYARAKMFEGATTPEAIRALALTPEQATTAANAAAGRTETARHNVIEERQGASRIANENQGLRIRTVEADPFGQFGLNRNPIGGGAPGAPGGPSAPLLTGEDYLKTLPLGMAAQVKAIAEGRQNPPPRASSGVALQIMNAVNQYDPNFSLQKAQIRKAFTTGSDGRNIGALNTAAVHLDQLAEAADALKNGSFTPANAAYNKISQWLGGAAPTNFAGVKAAVSGEMATALKGNATDPEIATIKRTIDESGSPEQLQQGVTTALHVLGAKLNTYQERYQQQIPGDTNWSPVLPSAKAVFEKHGINPTAGAAAIKSGGKFSVAAPNGKTYTFNSQADADAFKSAAGIK